MYAAYIKEAGGNSGNTGGNEGGGDSGNIGGNQGGDSGNIGAIESGDNGNSEGGNSANNGGNEAGGNNSSAADSTGNGADSGGGTDDATKPVSVKLTDAAGGSTDSRTDDKSKDNEPKTGDDTPFALYAALAMISGLAYVMLYFADRRRGMTKERKQELVAGIVGWAKSGGRMRRAFALAAIFIILVYYHSIGKTCVEWKEVYGE